MAQRSKAATTVMGSDGEPQTAMAAAFADAGIRSGEGIDEALTRIKTRDIVQEIQEKTQQIAAGNPDFDRVRAEIDASRELASEHADLLEETARTLAYLHQQVPETRTGGGGRFGTMAVDLQKQFDRIQVENPLAFAEFQRRKTQRSQERRDTFVTEIRTEQAALRARKSISLYRACGGQSGNVVVTIEYDERKRNAQGDSVLTGKKRSGLILVECRDGMGHIVEGAPSRFLGFIVKFGKDRDGNDRWVALDPENDFEVSSGAQFPNIVREGLAKKWASENAYRAQSDRTSALLKERTITVTELVEGMEGVAAFHVRTWQAQNRDKRPIRGSITLKLTGNGNGQITLAEVVTSVFNVDGFLGNELSLPLDGEGSTIPTFLRRLLAFRVSYEKRKATANETLDDDASADETPDAAEDVPNDAESAS